MTQIPRKKFFSFVFSLFVGFLFSISLLFHSQIGQSAIFLDKFVFCAIAATPVAILTYSLIAYLTRFRFKTSLILFFLSLITAAILIIGFNFSIPIPRTHELVVTNPAQNSPNVFIEMQYLQNVSNFPKMIYFNKAKISGNYETRGVEVEKVNVSLNPGSSLDVSFYSIGDLQLVAEVSKCPSGITITWDKKVITDEICSILKNGSLFLPQGSGKPLSRKWTTINYSIKLIDFLLIAYAIFVIFLLFDTLRRSIITKSGTKDFVIIEPMGWFLHIFIYTVIASTCILLLAFFKGISETRIFLPIVIFLALDCTIFLVDKKLKLKQPSLVLLCAVCFIGIIFNLLGTPLYSDIEPYLPMTYPVSSNSINALTNALNIETRDMYTLMISYDKALYQRDVQIPESISKELNLFIDYLQIRARALSVKTIAIDPQINEITWECLIQNKYVIKTSTQGKSIYFVDPNLYQNGDSVTAREFEGKIIFFPSKLILPEGKCGR